MSIVSFNTLTPGLVGVSPRVVQLVVTDNLSTLTTAGYLNRQGQVLQGFAFYPTDVLLVSYSYSLASNSGTFGVFLPSISATGVITLAQWVNSGDVLLPVVSNDFAVFNGTTGQIKDAGYLPSDPAKTVVAMMNAAVTLNHVAQFADTAGTLKDGGVLGTAAAKAASDNAKATVASVNGAVVSGNLAKYADTSGTVADQGVAFKSVGLAAVAGGAAAQTVTDAFCTSTSCVVASWNDTTNAVSIQKVAAGNGSFIVTSSADPGASHLNYIITKQGL